MDQRFTHKHNFSIDHIVGLLISIAIQPKGGQLHLQPVREKYS